MTKAGMTSNKQPLEGEKVPPKNWLKIFLISSAIMGGWSLTPLGIGFQDGAIRQMRLENIESSSSLSEIIESSTNALNLTGLEVLSIFWERPLPIEFVLLAVIISILLTLTYILSESETIEALRAANRSKRKIMQNLSVHIRSLITGTFIFLF